MGYLLDREGKWVLKKAKATSKEVEKYDDEDVVQWRKFVDGWLGVIEKQ